MATPIDIPIEITPPDLGSTVNAFKALKNELREARGALANLTAGTPEFIAQAERVGQLNDQISDLNANVAAVSGTPIENLSGSFGLLSGQVSSLNFEDAATSLRQFGASAGQIKLSDLGAQFKAFGKVAFDVGKSLLLNPLFLIPALIIGIGVALFALKDKVKIIGDAFDFIGKEIGKVVQTLKDFSDLLGLTSFAAEEAAEKQAAAAEKQTAALTDRYDTEIKLAKAAGKSTVELEKQKGDAVRASIRDQIQALVKLALINGKYSEEQLKQLEEFKKAYKDSLVESTVASLEENKKRTDDSKKAYAEQLAANKTLQKQIDDLKIQSIKDEDDRAAAKLKLDYQRGIQEINQSKALQTLKNDALLALQQDYEDKLAALEKKKTDAAFAQLTAEADKKQIEDQNKIAEEQKKTDDAFAQLTAEADLNDKFNKEKVEKAKAVAQAQREAEYDIALQGVGALQNLSDIVFTIKKSGLEKGTKAEEDAARKQFQINKALQIVGAVISSIQGVQNALSAKSILPEPFATGFRIASAVSIGIAGAANVAKIAATQFNPSSSGGGSGSGAATPSSAGNGGSISQPNPQSTAFNPNTVGQVGAPGAQNASNQPQRVYVVETDISNVQNKVAVAESQASIF